MAVVSIQPSVAVVGLGGSTSISVDVAIPEGSNLAAWTIDVAYHPEVLLSLQCEEQQLSTCNPSYTPNTARIAGAVLPGLTGTQTLARFTLYTSAIIQQSDITLSIVEFLDASTELLPVTTVNSTVQTVSP